MTVEELLEHFNNKETIGEDFKVIEMMRELSAKARKITMEIKMKCPILLERFV